MEKSSIFRDVIEGPFRWSVECTDAMAFLKSLPAKSVDLVMCSPPYELARDYLENGKNLSIARSTDAWVTWLVGLAHEMRRVCRGLCCMVVAGQTKKFRWSAGPALLIADLHRAGFHLRTPPIFHRIGIPGSGGPDWFRNDYEFCVCFTDGGKLPWSDNTACGHPPVFAPGGEMSYRNAEGKRKNQRHFRHNEDRSVKGSHDRDIVAIANPGNVPEHTYTASEVRELLKQESDVSRHLVGGGVMGHPLAHENEAPYPLSLAERFILSCCPPGGIVCDPFSGSGTTLHAAVINGRRFVGCDLRQSQVDLTTKRAESITPPLFE